MVVIALPTGGPTQRPVPRAVSPFCDRPPLQYDPVDDLSAGAYVCATQAKMRVASMGQRNTRLKFIGWSLEPQRLSRALIQAQRDLVEI